MAFARWTSCFDRTRVFARFKAHHTEINDLYWSLVPVSHAAKFQYRMAPQSHSPAMLFHATGPDARRLAPTLPEWSRNFSELENWLRLSMLVSALLYLETYISTVVTTALRSDPLLRFKQSRSIDGTIWLKKNVDDDVSSLVLDCVKGTWSKRLAGCKNLFGIIPAGLAPLEGDLEKMRVLRNGSAHSFGRSPIHFEDPTAPVGASKRLSEQTLLRYLGIIEQAAWAIEQHIARHHIGEFELLWQYHKWQALPRVKSETKYTEQAAFSREVGRLYGQTPGRNFCRQLMQYYKRI